MESHPKVIRISTRSSQVGLRHGQASFISVRFGIHFGLPHFGLCSAGTFLIQAHTWRASRLRHRTHQVNFQKLFKNNAINPKQCTPLKIRSPPPPGFSTRGHGMFPHLNDSWQKKSRSGQHAPVVVVGVPEEDDGGDLHTHPGQRPKNVQKPNSRSDAETLPRSKPSHF